MSCLNLPIVLYCILFCYLFVLFSLVSSFWVLGPRPKHLGPMDPSLWGPHVLGAHRQATNSSPRGENRGGPKVFLFGLPRQDPSWLNLGLPSAQPKVHILCRFHFPCVSRHVPSCFVPFHEDSWRPNSPHGPPAFACVA